MTLPRKAAARVRADRRGELLEVHGFDLLAQVEALLRHVREYQREVQRLRGIMGRGQTSTQDASPLSAVRTHLGHLQEIVQSFGETIADARKLADDAEPGAAPARRRRT